MFHTYKDLELALFPCLLIFFQAQNLLVLSPCLWLILLNHPLFQNQFQYVVISYIFSLFFLACLEFVFANANLIFFFLLHLFGGPMFCILVTLMLPGKFCVLILSYLAAKVVLFGKVMFNGSARH